MKRDRSGSARSTLVFVLVLVCSVAGYGQSSVEAPDFSLIGFANENGKTTGGAGGKTVTVSNTADFTAAVSAAEPLTVLVSGTLDLSGKTVNIGSNKTIIGLGNDAGFVGHIFLKGVNNIIIRNLSFTNRNGVGQGMGGGDCMTSNSAHHVWVDHCDFSDSPDGQLDITHGSDFFTISWCKFSYTNDASDHRLSMLIGNRDDLEAEDSGKLNVTLHHNWIGDYVYGRAPRVRFGKVHVFNTYFNAKGNNTCCEIGISSQILLESVFFDGIKRPWKSRNDSGRLQCNDDILYNYGEKIQMGPTAKIDFKPPYAYKLDAASTVKDIVTKYAGVGKGPFAPK